MAARVTTPAAGSEEALANGADGRGPHVAADALVLGRLRLDDETKARWRSRWPWVAMPLLALVSLWLGAALFGSESPPATEMEGEHDGHEPAEAAQLPPTRVELTDRARALARLETVPVHRLPSPAVDVRLLGRVDYDETRLSNVTAWTGGRIDRLHVETTGERVRRGQVVATIYSPEIYAAHQDLVTARRQVQRLSSGSPLARSSAEAALEAARQRLRLLGVTGQRLERLASSSRPARQITISTPFAGTVIERGATEGAYIQTGTVLYRVADLSRVWVQLEAYERDLALLSLGQTVELRFEAIPDQTFDGTVTFMDPTVDPQRRVARVRVELDNPGGRLLPGMFAEAIVAGSLGDDHPRPLVIPESAPLFTGRRSVVFVERPGAERPTYDARLVRLGPRMGQRYPVVAGLAEGERIVSEGAFFLDADLQIRGGQSMMRMPDDTVHGPYDEIVEVPEEFREGLRRVLVAYLDMQAALADDDVQAAREAAARLTAAAQTFEPDTPAGAAATWRELAHHLRRHGQEASEATSIEELRAVFERITAQIRALLQTFGNPLEDPLRVAECPMAFGNQGAEWFQRDERVQNAFFGEVMESCGEIRMTLEPGSYLMAPLEHDAQAARPAGGHSH